MMIMSNKGNPRIEVQPFVPALAEGDQGLLPLVGGKGANLGEMMRIGLPVPPGFCVTTMAYARVAAEAQIDLLIGEMEQTPANSTERLAALASQIRDRIESISFPAGVADAITAAYRQLGDDVSVAVRSSATAEDLPQAAFAGQQDTFLNMTGSEAVLDAVQRCWASLWTDRAIAYRKRQKIDQQTVKIAVVVQRMIPAEVAGVMFTANPINGARDEMVVDASPGLGEAIVSGLVTPDHFVLAKRLGRVKERQLGRREVIIQARPGGGTERVEWSASVDMPTLSGRALRQLPLGSDH
jgi:pyruvate,water dikinase